MLQDEINTENLDWTVFGDKLYIVNGENYYQYDGTTFEEVEASTEQGADLTAVKRCKVSHTETDSSLPHGDSENLIQSTTENLLTQTISRPPIKLKQYQMTTTTL